VTRLLIWDSTGAPPPTADRVLYWNGYGGSDGGQFILDYCERNSVRLRDRYTAWIHDLGETRIRDRRLVDHLAGPGAPSLWWMSLLVEKSFAKSPVLNDVIRVLALDEILRETRPTHVTLASPNGPLNAAIEGTCAGYGIPYVWDRSASAEALDGERTTGWRGFVRRLPHPVQAVAYLVRELVAARAFRRIERPVWVAGPEARFFCSYFFNLSAADATEGRFRSAYWGELHESMAEAGLTPNWLHLFVPNAVTPTPADASRLVETFNREAPGRGRHAILQSYLSPMAAMRAVARWIRTAVASSRLTGIERAFRPSGGEARLWPLLADDWRSSIRGATAMANAIYVELFAAALQTLPPQPGGYYLCENQAWERALVDAWHRKQSAPIVAVPHSTRSFWDLRFAHDSRTLASRLPYPLPWPDDTTVNGAAALTIFNGESIPSDQLVKAEALRYTYLRGMLARTDRATSRGKRPIEVLVLGDYSPDATTRMLRLLAAIDPIAARQIHLTLKPHPRSPVDRDDHPGLEFDVRMTPLEQLLSNADVAFSSNKTSAAVDAYVAGVPVVVMLEPRELNYSPLRGHPGVTFVSTPSQAAASFLAAAPAPRARDDFFFLDRGLPRWTQLLVSSGRFS